VTELHLEGEEVQAEADIANQLKRADPLGGNAGKLKKMASADSGIYTAW
jgi:hypothetical protein